MEAGALGVQDQPPLHRVKGQLGMCESLSEINYDGAGHSDSQPLAVSELGGLRQEAYLKFEVNLGYK